MIATEYEGPVNATWVFATGIKMAAFLPREAVGPPSGLSEDLPRSNDKEVRAETKQNRATDT
jgi:hypothetical protein